MNNKSRFKLVVGIALMVLTGGICYSSQTSTIDPSDIGVGARAVGMGKAFTAISNDVNGVFMNPAGLYQVRSMEFTSMQSKILEGITYTLLGITQPVPMGGTFGVGYVGAAAGDIILTTLDSSNRAADSGDRMGYSSNVVVLSYGSEQGVLSRLWRPLENVSFGTNLKVFNQSFSGNGGQTALGLDLDLGVLIKPRSYLTFSILGRNMLPSSSANIGTLVWSGGARESIPSTLTLGTAIKLIGQGSPRVIGEQQLLGAIDLNYDSGGKPILMHAGMEWMPISFMALRVGLNQDYAGGSGVGNISSDMTFGVGLKIGKIDFDYAYENSQVLTQNSTHYFSISLKDLFPAPAVVPVKNIAQAVKPAAIKEVLAESKDLTPLVKQAIKDINNAPVKNLKVTSN